MRTPSTRTFLGLVATTLVLAGLHWSRDQIALREMRAMGAELERALAEQVTTRPVLRGEPIEGLAQLEYERATESLSATMQEDWRELMRLRLDDPEGALRLRDCMLAENRATLEALARGARHTDARRVVDWSKGFSVSTPRLIDSRHVANLTVLSAESHLDAGRADLAVDALLDGMQYGGDTMHAPLVIGRMVGCALLSITTKEALIDGGLLDRLPASELERLAAKMSLLESGLPSTMGMWDGELVAFVNSLANADFGLDNLTGNPGAVLMTWRHGFSARVMCADYVSEAKQWRDLQREGSDWSWQEWQAHFEAFDEQRSPSLVRDVVDSHRPGVEEAYRGALTLLNLTRCVVEFRASGEARVLPDPFGDELTVSLSGDRLQVASCGPDEDSRHRERYVVDVARRGS